MRFRKTQGVSRPLTRSVVFAEGEKARPSSREMAGCISAVDRSHAIVMGIALFFEPIYKAVTTGLRLVTPVPYKLDALFIYGLCAYFILKLVPSIVRHFPWEELLGAILFYICVLTSLLLHGFYPAADNLHMAILVDLLKASIPYYMLFRFKVDRWKVIKVLGPMAIAATVSMVANTYIFTWQEGKDYSMYFGYMTLTPCIVCQLCLFSSEEKWRRTIYAVMSAVGMVTLISDGARGPFVAALSFLVLELIFGLRTRGFRRLLYASSIATAGIVLFRHFDSLIDAIVWLTVRFGGSGRFVAKVTETGSLFTSLGRRQLYPVVFRLINENWLFGCGVGNDRVLIASAMCSANVYGYYPHNLFLELILQFGMIVGCVMSLGLLCLLWEAYGQANPFGRKLLYAMVCLGLVPLMFSHSYTDSPLFFSMLAVAVGLIRERSIGGRRST